MSCTNSSTLAITGRLYGLEKLRIKGRVNIKRGREGGIINLSHRGGIRNYRSYIFSVRWQLSSRIPAPYQTRFGSFSTNTDCWHLNDRRSCIIERDWEVTGSQMWYETGINIVLS